MKLNKKNILLAVIVSFYFSVFASENFEIINGMTGDMNGTGPFMVYLKPFKVSPEGVVKKGGCSGVLIEKDIVATAAHCFLMQKYDQVEIHFTLKYQENLPSYLVVKTNKIVNHEKYNSTQQIYKNEGYQDNDITLIYFNEGLPKGYRPVNYRIKTDSIYLATKALVAGYGLTYDTLDPKAQPYSENQGRLNSTWLMFDSEFPKLDIFSTHIAADQLSKTGMCRGDSGGAALVRDANKNFLLLGINSMAGSGETCFGKAFFTRLSLFQEWIARNIIKLRSQ